MYVVDFLDTYLHISVLRLQLFTPHEGLLYRKLVCEMGIAPPAT